MNKGKYNEMLAAQKKVIDDHCTTEWAAKFADPWADFEHAGLEKIKAMPGHEVYPLTAEQLAAWKKSADPVTHQVLSALGSVPTAVDELVRRCQVSAAAMAEVLLALELEGRLERHRGNRVSLM